LEYLREYQQKIRLVSQNDWKKVHYGNLYVVKNISERIRTMSVLKKATFFRNSFFSQVLFN
jgi:hypothetical protein